jgi:WD40 repeat protein
LRACKRAVIYWHQEAQVRLVLKTDKSIRIWDLSQGICLKVLEGHSDLVRTLQFNNDYLVSGSYDKVLIDLLQSVLIWCMKTGEILHKLQKHTNRVFKLHFKDTKIVSCSQDQSIIIWDFAQDVNPRYFD